MVLCISRKSVMQILILEMQMTCYQKVIYTIFVATFVCSLACGEKCIVPCGCNDLNLLRNHCYDLVCVAS